MPPGEPQATLVPPPETPELRAATSVLASGLLAVTGGSLDAFLYLNHGHVFAGAMTGNAVLCGIALLHRDKAEILHHAAPFLAFVLGVWIFEVLDDHLEEHAVSVGLFLEASGLLAASFLSARFPDHLFVFLIALLAAFQIATFRKVDSFAYNSTFITGDLRTLLFGLYEALQPRTRSEGLRKARDLGVVVGCFIIGALLGASLSHHMANHTLWLPVLLLWAVLLLATQSGRDIRPSTA